MFRARVEGFPQIQKCNFSNRRYFHRCELANEQSQVIPPQQLDSLAASGMPAASRVLTILMIEAITHLFEKKANTKTRSPETMAVPKSPAELESGQRDQRFGFSKIFRWPVPAGQTPQPAAVEIVGSFTGWRKIPLVYDQITKSWQVMLNSIEGNRTHRYVILVDGKPTYDKTCDGLTIPESPEEAKWQIETPRGPRVMLMFAQAK